MFKETLWRGALLVGMTAALAGCGSGGSGGASSISSMTITANIGTGTVTSSGELIRHAVLVDNKGVALDARTPEYNMYGVNTLANNTFAVSDYGLRCVTLSGTPEVGTGQADSNGNVSLTLASATNVPIGCFVINVTAGGTLIAALAFQATGTDINGNPVREGTYVAGDGTSGLQFGSITLDLTKGQAVCTKSAVVATGGTGGATLTGSFVDMTGTWTMHAASSLPTGYSTVNSTNDGSGTPYEGMTIYLGQYHAKDGSNADHYGLTIWKSSTALTSTCGGEGLTLPSGWSLTGSSSTNHYLTDAMTGLSLGFPNPTLGSIASASGGGNLLCGLGSIVAAHPTCRDFETYYATGTVGSASNGTVWAAVSGGTTVNSHWGMTPKDCEFYCAMNSIWSISQNNTSACYGEFNVDWQNLWGSGGTVQTDPFSNITWTGSAWTGLSTVAVSDNETVAYSIGGTLANVIFKKRPKQRFIANEMIINGNVGSVLDHSYWTSSACPGSYNGNNCSVPMVSCHVQETNKLTITQTSATTALAELIQSHNVSPTDDSSCTTDSNAHIDLSTQKFLFVLHQGSGT